jgi:hypothetical protein
VVQADRAYKETAAITHKRDWQGWVGDTLADANLVGLFGSVLSHINPEKMTYGNFSVSGLAGLGIGAATGAGRGQKGWTVERGLTQLSNSPIGGIKEGTDRVHVDQRRRTGNMTSRGLKPGDQLRNLPAVGASVLRSRALYGSNFSIVGNLAGTAIGNCFQDESIEPIGPTNLSTSAIVGLVVTGVLGAGLSLYTNKFRDWRPNTASNSPRTELPNPENGDGNRHSVVHFALRSTRTNATR